MCSMLLERIVLFPYYQNGAAILIGERNPPMPELHATAIPSATDVGPFASTSRRARSTICATVWRALAGPTKSPAWAGAGAFGRVSKGVGRVLADFLRLALYTRRS